MNPPLGELLYCFVDRCLSICPFSFVHCVVCPSPTYGFLLPLWYLQTFLMFQTTMQLTKLIYLITRALANGYTTRECDINFFTSR